jgi:pilus assembly protein Flp/PilA
MNDKLLLLSNKIRVFLSSQEGQDLIEYALVVALISFGSTAAMSSLASDINTIFTNIGTTLSGAIT